MGNTKKTQTTNAMKPSSKAAADDAKTAQADAKAAVAKDPAPVTGAPGEGGVSASAGNTDPGEQGTDIENHPTPAEREAQAGTKQDAATDQTSAGIENKGPDVAAADETEGGEKPAPELADEYDLDDPRQAQALAEKVIEDLISFGHPIAGALGNKPNVLKTWDELQRKAKKLQGFINKQKAAH